MAQQPKDFYQTLGVPRTATPEEIKKAYRKLAVKFHPDRNPGDATAEAKFKEISEAYDVLKDEKTRQIYDQFGAAGASQGFYGAGADPRGFRDPFRGGFKSKTGGSEGFQDLFGDIFEDLFRSGGAGGAGFRTASGRPRSKDLQYTLQISLEEAASGCQPTIRFVRQRGSQQSTAQLSVSVPPGVKTGQKLKLRGEGDQPEGVPEPSDLYVLVQTKPHDIFERDGDHVRMDLPLSFVDSALGTVAEIPTLYGKAQLKIPPGTSSGKTFRLKGKGFPSLASKGQQGDMLVRIMIDTPSEWSPEQVQLLERLRTKAEEGTQIKKFREKLKKTSAPK